MPKLRNASTDVGMFAQWIGRKCRNHAPLEELFHSKEARKALPSRYQTHQTKQEVYATAEGTIVCTAGDRMFVLEVREIESSTERQEIAKGQRVAVGR